MHIVVITSSYPRFEQDIAGVFVYEFCDYLGALGHQVHVFTWDDAAVVERPQPANHSVEFVSYAPIKYESLFYGAGVPENLSSNPWKWLLVPGAVMSMLLAVNTYISKCTPKVDLVVGHWLVPGGLIARVLGHWREIPSLVVGHSGGAHLLATLPTILRRRLVRALSTGPITVPTMALRNKIASWLPNTPIYVAPMGFSPPPTPTSFNDAIIPENSRDWLCLGRLVPIKNIRLAIDAFARAKLPPQRCLHIVGDGPEREMLENHARKIGANIKFYGRLVGEEKYNIMRRAGFMLLPSITMADGRHEGLPVTLLEASSMGIITLVSNIPGVRPYLAREELQCLGSWWVDDWAAAIRQYEVLTDTQKTQWARECVRQVEPYSWPQWIQYWDRLLTANQWD